MLSRIKSRRGFSLIELAVVLIVIGFIAAIAIPTFKTVLDKSAARSLNASAEALVRNLDAVAAFGDEMTDADVQAVAAESDLAWSYSDENTDADDPVGDTLTATKDNKTVVVTFGASPNGRSEVTTRAS